MAKQQAGLSLVEVLISIVVLGVVAALIALAIPTSAGLSVRTHKLDSSTAVAQKYIEDVKAAYAADPSLFNSIQSGDTPPISIESFHTNNGNYSISTEVTIDNTFETDTDGDEVDETVPCLFTLHLTVTPIKAGETESDSDQQVSVSAIIRRDRA